MLPRYEQYRTVIDCRLSRHGRHVVELVHHGQPHRHELFVRPAVHKQTVFSFHFPNPPRACGGKFCSIVFSNNSDPVRKVGAFLLR